MALENTIMADDERTNAGNTVVNLVGVDYGKLVESLRYLKRTGESHVRPGSDPLSPAGTEISPEKVVANDASCDSHIETGLPVVRNRG
jgi:hypothetical protein